MTTAAKARSRYAARLDAARPRMRHLIEEFLRTPFRYWRSAAACRDADPTLFVPADRPGKSPRAFEHEAAEIANHEKARKFCLACPVIAECLAHALENEEEGTWGGERFTTLDWEAGRAVKKELGL